MNEIEKQLSAARNSLLDLSLRNRLLNFRPTKSRTLRIVLDDPAAIYEALVLKEREIELLAKPEEKTPTSEEPPVSNALAPVPSIESEESEESELPLFEGTAHRESSFRTLPTAIESAELYRFLSHINQQARSFVEEQGYTILYLALGFLEWNEKSTTPMNRAPLVLVPVELERRRIRDPFKLKWTGEEILGNISLQEKLVEQKIQLPEFEMTYEKAGIEQYFQSIQEACKVKEGWRVLNGIYLDFFSFTKFVMYKDLAPEAWPEGMSPADHPLIRSILYPTGEVTPSQGISDQELDQKLASIQAYQIMDADSSQLAVIEEVKAGKSLVVEGPPGTGKSQTITNIIAELLATGKSVLFMSEKMAALEVVKNRLDHAGLGEFCLELHSQKTKKKEFLEELKRASFTIAPETTSFQDRFDLLENARIELSNYVRVLREPFRKFGRSPYELFSLKESAWQHFLKVGRVMPRFKFVDLKESDQKECAFMLERFTHLAKALPSVKPIHQHPWKGADPGTVLPADKEEIAQLVQDAISEMDRLETALNRLLRICTIKPPVNFQELQQLLPKIKKIAFSDPISRTVYLNPAWNQPPEKAEELLTKVENFQQKMLKFAPKALDQDILSLQEEYKEFSKKWLVFLDSRYRSLNKELIQLYKNLPPREPQRILADLERLIECSKAREEIRKTLKEAQSLFGNLWQGEQSDVPKLRSFMKEMLTFRQELLQSVFREPQGEMIRAGVSWEQIQQALDQVEEASKQFLQIQRQLASRLTLEAMTIFGAKLTEVPFLELISRFRLWNAELHRLQSWGQYMTLRKECAQTKANAFLDWIESDQVEAEDIVPAFHGNFADEVLRLAFLEKPELSKFIGELHEEKIKRFKELDREILQLNRKRLVEKLHQNRPKLTGGASPGSEAGILLGEFNRKRRHMPIRKLLTSTGSLIQKIKPCFMMSPLSIAKFLDPRSIRFDVIIFDEASQVKPEDAFGALLRGRQLVVMGDTSQLPPTSFFENIVEAEEADGEEAILTDMESILHQCKRSFPTKTLRWHYRSKHETLIAVSNQEFYHNRLFVYPSASAHSKNLGLYMVYLPDTVYDRGKTSVNQKEAEAVAQAAMEHYQRFPQKSLGIGAFNVKQQEAILEAVEKLLRQHPEMEDFFRATRKEHFFVKNLETIQGDERDVIFISVGFGFNETRKFSLNFGPLNQSGGERRLNVLISRAREKCVVFSNFRASDLQLEPTAPTGLKALKIFLEYAETGKLLSAKPIKIEANSAFEEAVLNFLKKQGYLVEQKIGCGEFRMDLAIMDPQMPDHYLLGIESDGPKYHSCLITRDRDRLRPQILESLGWHLYRIWSPDWYCKRTETEQHLLESIRKAKLEATQNVSLHRNDDWESQETLGATFRPKMLENKDTKEIKVLGLKELAKLSNSSPKTPSEKTPPLPLNESDILFSSENSPETKENTKQETTVSEEIEASVNEQEASSAPTKELQNLFPESSETPSACDESEEGEEPIVESYYEEDTTSSSVSYFDEEGFPAPFLYSAPNRSKENYSGGSKTKRKNTILPEPEIPEPEKTPSNATEIELPPSQLDTMIPLYEVCQSLSSGLEGKLQEMPLEQLSLAILQVVNIEGPIHYEEVFRRMRTLFGIKRTTNKIQEILGKALLIAEQSQKIRRLEDFLWPIQTRNSLLRKRSGEEVPPKIEMICEEEIREAVQWVLKHQFASPLKELTSQVARLFGFQKSHQKTLARIEEVIQKMIQSNLLQKKPNEMIDFHHPL